MAQFNIGPTYCETLSALNATSVTYPIEPANTVSNGVIVLFGLASMYMVAKRTPRAYDLYVVSALLIACGIGSGIWHGFRDGTALFWEVRAGLFFLLGLAVCWAWRLWLAGRSRRLRRRLRLHLRILARLFRHRWPALGRGRAGGRSCSAPSSPPRR